MWTKQRDQSPKMLWETGETIAKPLTRLINMSLSTTQFLETWKLANVLPLFKKNDKTQIKIYRPISLLSCVSKIAERVVFKYTFNFIRDHRLITKFQSGFTPGDSTINQLVHVYYLLCEALDKNKEVRVVFCDISKAFDRVWHRGLLYKLRKSGLQGICITGLKVTYPTENSESFLAVPHPISVKFKQASHKDPFWVPCYFWFL